MKNIALYLSIIALIAVTLLFIDRFSGNESKSSSDVEQTKEMSAVSGGIAYVNIDSLVDSYDYYNKLKTGLMLKQKNMEKDLESKYMSLQRKAMELQSKVEKRLMTQTTAQKEQQKLMVQEQQLMADKQNSEMTLAEANQNMTVEILDSINAFLEDYNKDKRFSLILSNNSMAGPIIQADDKMDITFTVIEGLNKRYRDADKKEENN